MSYRDRDAILASISQSSEQKNGVVHANRAHHFGARLLLTKLAQLRSDAATATAALQTIRNRTSPTAAQVAADVKTEAQIMQQVIQRLLAIVLYATGDLSDNTGT
jgi:hypothetical protein